MPIGAENFLSNSPFLVARFLTPTTQGSLGFTLGAPLPMIKLAGVF